MGKRWAWLGVLVAVMMVQAVAGAHQTDRAEQQTEVRAESGEVEHLYSLSATDLTHHLGFSDHDDEITQEMLDEHRQALKDYINDYTLVEADGEECELGEYEFVAYPAEDGRVHFLQLWECPAEPEEVEIHNQVMLDMHHGGYRHMARIQVGDDIFPTVFDPSYPSYSVYPGHGERSGSSGADDAPDEGAGESAGEEGDEERGPFSWALIASLIIVVVGTLWWWVRKRN